MRGIKPLPEGVRNSVRSGVILYDLTKVVEELVFNSLDAGATKVSVAVGVVTCFVKVADNGSGIDRDGLMLLGERYATSKHDHLADLGTSLGSFGFHGEALCSISDVSVLEVISKSHGMPHGYRKVMKNCKCLYLGISDDRHDVGTTVIVRDLFYNQPVRRKHVLSSPKKVLHLAKKCVLRIALVHPRVSFKVFDIESQEELLGTCSSPSPLSLLSTNFGTEAASSLSELVASKGELKLSGYLSTPFGISSPKDWGPVLEFIQDAVTHFWSENASDDLPEYCESRRKKSRTHKWSSPVEVPFSQLKKQIVDEIGLSSCQMRNRGASELIKHHKDAFLTRGADCAIHLFDTSLFASGVTTSKMIHRGEPVSDNLYSNVDNYILNSTKDSSCKKLDYLSDSKWRSGPSLMKDQMDMLTKSSLCADFHEVTDADANRVFGKSYQLSSLKGISLQDVGPSFPYEAGIEFSNAELSMQRRHLHIGEDVDVGNQYDTDLIFEENEPRHNIVKPLWLSKCANQHDKMLKSKSLSHDVRPSIIAGEWSDEENFFGSYSFEDGKKYGINRLSSTSELSPRISNCLFGQIPDTVHFMGGDVHSKNGKDTEYDYYEDREEKYCNFNSDAAVNCLDVAHSTEVFSDCKYYSSLQGDFGEIRGDKLKYSCSTNFSDEENWLCTNKSGKSSRLNSSDPLSYKSVLTQLDSNKFERIQTENRKAQVHRREARRSISAPPLYKRRRKFFDLNNMFEIAAEQIDSDDTTLAISNAKHDLQAFDERRCPPKQSYVSDSLCIPRLENEGFQKKDFMSNEILDSSEYDVKWQKSCEQAMGVMKTQNAGDDDILNVSSGILHFACDSLVPASISKTCFRDAKVLRQVDKKFIPVVAGNILAMIDQHAADERIRLEELRQKVLSGEMRQITYLETEKELVLPEIDYQLLHNYGEQAQNWGWICNICGPSSRSFAKKMNVLHRQQTVAKLIAVPCILGVNLTDNDLLEFLKQLADTDGSSTVPPSVLRILNNKACRGAIMFGDTLLPSECSLIVEELKRTSLCFQCAHGRPTTVPLVNLEVLHRQIDKLALRRKGKQELWHGLGRHEISLERAAYRLNSAMN